MIREMKNYAFCCNLFCHNVKQNAHEINVLQIRHYVQTTSDYNALLINVVSVHKKTEMSYNHVE